jgi:hypothetical protein
MKFRLQAWDDDRENEYEHSFEAEELPRVLSRLVDFLRSCGFSYVDGMSIIAKGKEQNEQEWKYHNDDNGEYP